MITRRSTYLSFYSRWIAVIVYVSLLTFVCDGQEFRELSKSIGLRHATVDKNIMSGGIALIDYNNDHYLDIFIPGGENPNLLYRNNWDGTFSDVSEETGISFRESNCVGVAVGDINNDGFDDLFLTTYVNESNILLLNEGGSRFVDISRTSGIIEKSWSTSATFGDYNLDGLIDIYVANYANFSSEPFADNIESCEANFLYKNLGNNIFVNVAEEMGVADVGCGLAVSFIDYDRDNDVDILVGNDFGLSFEPNQLYVNNRTEDRFYIVEEHSNLNIRINAMGIAKGDYDEDGDVDLYITNIAENAFFNNRLNPIYVDIANLRNVANADGTSWGTSFADINNDSYLDLIVANGQVIQADHQNNENRLYLGDTHGTFEDVSSEYNIDSDFRCRGLAVGDLDNDGDMELLFGVVAEDRQNELYPLVHENNCDTSMSWLKVKPIGVKANKNGYGAIVKVYFNGRVLMREVDGGSSYLSHSSNYVHFGLGNEDTIDSLVVIWPGGARNVFEDIYTKISYTLVENGRAYINTNETITILERDSILLGDQYRSISGTYSFYEVEEEIGYNHVVKLILSERPAIDNLELLFSVVPNPFDQNATAYISIPDEGQVQLALFDVNGKLIQEMLNQQVQSGIYEYNLNDYYSNLPSGVYFLRLVYNAEVRIRKIVQK